MLPRFILINIYKAHVRPHLDYGDEIYDNSSNASLSQMIESVQYNAALVIRGTIRGSSREKLYQELRLESLHDRRWYRKLCFYSKITHNDCPLYLMELLPIVKSSGYSLRSNQSFYYSRTECFKASFFPSSTYNWNQLDPDSQNSSSLGIYKRALLKFIRPTSDNVYKIHHPRGLKLLTRLRLGLSYLREHKFRHNFNDTIDPFCLYRTNCLEATEHFLLHCLIYASFRLNVFDNLRNNNILVLPLNKSSTAQMFLYESESYDQTDNNFTISCIINFIIPSRRFDDPLFN